MIDQGNGNDSPSLSALHHEPALVEAFRAAWRSGEEPSLAGYLPEAGPGRLELLLALLTFRDVKRKSILFQQVGLQEQADFRVLGQVSQTISREEAAVSQAAVQIARTVVNLAIERF